MNRATPSRVAFLLLSCLALAGYSPAGATTRQEFDAFAERYLDAWYAANPVRATRDGIHAHDSMVSGYTREQIGQEVDRLRSALRTLEAMRPSALDSLRQHDHAMLTARVQADLLELDVIRPWQKNPAWYIDLILDGLRPLATRSFAPESERLRSVIARQKQAGAILAAAVENVSVPPRVMTEAAIERAAELAAFLDNELPAAFAGVADTALVGEWRTVNASVRRDLQSYRGYLDDLLPGSTGDFKLGQEAFEQKLRFEEMCDIPAYRIERHADQELRRIKLSIMSTTAAIDREKTPVQLNRVLSIDHPRADRLLDEVDRVSTRLREFCATKELLVTPAGAACRAVGAPERSPAPLTLDAAGPFEKSARDARLLVALPGPKRRGIEIDDFLRAYNRYQLPLLTAAETWPGGLAAGELRVKAPSRIRKALAFRTMTEGWKSYVRGMVLDEGFAGNAPEYEFYRLNLEMMDAARCIVAIRLHTSVMSLEDAARFFETEASLPRDEALREAWRAALDPMSVAPLIGRLQLAKLREDYRRNLGPAYTVARFHDRALSFGAPPPRLLRQMLMPGDKGSVL